MTVRQVIAAARSEGGLGEDCPLPESTVHRILHRAGLMAKALDAGTSKDRRRFTYPWAGDLLMSDVMHGPALPRDGRRKRKTYQSPAQKQRGARAYVVEDTGKPNN